MQSLTRSMLCCVQCGPGQKSTQRVRRCQTPQSIVGSQQALVRGLFRNGHRRVVAWVAHTGRPFTIQDCDQLTHNQP